MDTRSSASASASKRAWYAHSKRVCAHGYDGTLVTVNEAVQRRRRLLGAGTASTKPPAELYAEKVQSATSRVERTFTLVPVIKLDASASNGSLEAILDDDEAEAVEADCFVREAAVQPQAPWALDWLDGHRNGVYSYGVATGLGATVYVLDGGIRTSHSELGGRAIGGYSAACRLGTEPFCVSNGGSWPRDGVIDSTAAALGCSSHGTTPTGSHRVHALFTSPTGSHRVHALPTSPMGSHSARTTVHCIRVYPLLTEPNGICEL